ETARQALLIAHLQRVVIGIGARLEQVDIVETRIRSRDNWQSRRHDAWLRLIDVASRQQLRAFRSDVRDFEHAAAKNLSLDVEVPMLHITGAQITLDRKRGIRQREREERGKRIVERERQARQREEDVVVEERRVEIKRFSRREWRLIVVDAITATQHRLFIKGPGEPDAWREVVLVSFEATTWNAVRADRYETARDNIVNSRTIVSIHRRRVVLITQAGVERQSRRDAIAVVEEEVVTLGANLLRVIDTRHTRQEGKSEQQIAERVARELKERRKLQTPARLNISKSILLRKAQVRAELEQVIPVNVTRVVQKLVNIRDAVLRIVSFVTERRETGDGDEAETKVTLAC